MRTLKSGLMTLLFCMVGSLDASWSVGALLLAQTTASQAVGPAESMPVERFSDRVRREGIAYDLSLKDATRMALVENLEIAVEEVNEKIQRSRLAGLEGFYDPVFSLDAGYADNSTPTGSVIQAGAGVARFESNRGFWNSHVTQSLPWGATYTVDWLSSRSTANSTLLTVNPQFNSSLSLNFTQPLLRGLGQTEVRRQLSLTNLDVRLSQSQFEQKVADVVRAVQDQYWELVFALRNQEIRIQSLELARRQLADNRRRVEIGSLAPIEITASRAEVANREQELIVSEEGIQTAENALKRLLTGDSRGDLWNRAILPVEEPTFEELRISLDEAIGQAIERRPELAQARLQLDRNQVDERFYRSEGRWRVDLVSGYVSTGLSGVPSLGGVPDVSSPVFGSLGTLYSQVFGQDFRSYSAGVRVEIPLRNRENEMQLAQLALQARQIGSRIQAAEQQVAVEVRNAAESIETTHKRVEASRVARELSVEQLDGETKRFQAGLSTNFLVLQYQRDLGESQLRELRALIDYRKAMIAYQKATFSILAGNDLQTARKTP